MTRGGKHRRESAVSSERECSDAVFRQCVGARGKCEQRVLELIGEGSVRSSKTSEAEERRTGQKRRTFAQGQPEDTQGIAADRRIGLQPHIAFRQNLYAVVAPVRILRDFRGTDDRDDEFGVQRIFPDDQV